MAIRGHMACPQGVQPTHFIFIFIVTYMLMLFLDTSFLPGKPVSDHFLILAPALWWLILCVSLPGLQVAQVVDTVLLLSVSVRVFQKGWAHLFQYTMKEVCPNMGRLRTIRWHPAWNKKVKKGQILSLLELGRPFLLHSNILGPGSWASRFQDLTSTLPVFSYLWLQTVSYPSSSSGSQAYPTDSPGPPVCRQQIVGLLSFHNCVSQFQ